MRIGLLFIFKYSYTVLLENCVLNSVCRNKYTAPAYAVTQAAERSVFLFQKYINHLEISLGELIFQNYRNGSFEIGMKKCSKRLLPVYEYCSRIFALSCPCKQFSSVHIIIHINLSSAQKKASAGINILVSHLPGRNSFDQAFLISESNKSAPSQGLRAVKML